ncbi:hypothetical protein SprV_0100182700 [Sparganum proliferum]
MAEIGRRRAVSFCAPSLVKQLPKPLPEQTNLQVADDQLPTNKLCALARTSFSFSGSQKSSLYGLVNSQDIGSANDGEAFASSGPYCGNLLGESDSLAAFSSHAPRKVAVCVPPPPSLVLTAAFTEENSTPTVLSDPVNLKSALRETTGSPDRTGQTSRLSPSRKIWTSSVCSPNASLLDSTMVKEYLAQVTTKHPFNGLKENGNSQQLDEEKLAIKKISACRTLLHSPFIRPELYCPLQFPNVASMKMPVQNVAWVEQLKAHSPTPPVSKSPPKTVCHGYDSDGDAQQPVRRRLISDNSATANFCPSAAEEYVLDALTSKVEIEQVRHKFKELEKKSDATYLKLARSVSSAVAPFKIGDPFFGHRSGDHASSFNLANSHEKPARHILSPPPSSMSTCLSVPTSPKSRRAISMMTTTSPLASSLPHTSALAALSEGSPKPTREPSSKASSGLCFFGGKEAVARRIRGQEINLMTPVSF